METIVHNPATSIHAATSDYVHALEVRNPSRLLYASGTMGLDAKGLAGKTLTEQLALVWSNIRTILASAEMTVDNIVRVTSCLCACILSSFPRLSITDGSAHQRSKLASRS